MIPVFAVLIGGCIWAAGDRFWGSDDETDQMSKVNSAVFVGFAYSLLLMILDLPIWPEVNISFLICAAGFWLGRVQDGVRGTFLQKALRGWKYSGIYIGFALLLDSWYPLLPVLMFWQVGLIHWAICRISAATGFWDYVPSAEAINGFIRGSVLTFCLLLTGQIASHAY